MEIINIIAKIYEKLQKDSNIKYSIQFSKKDLKKLKDFCEFINYLSDECVSKLDLDLYYIKKTKIKEKIKEVDKDINWNNADDHYYCINILKNLLEE